MPTFIYFSSKLLEKFVHRLQGSCHWNSRKCTSKTSESSIHL